MKNSYLFRDGYAIILVVKKGIEYEVKIDKEDFLKVSSFKGTWHLNNRGYISRTVKGKRESIHRLIMEPLKDLVVDHIDNNPLNNSKENLRVITRGQNAQNIKSNKRNEIGIRGVSFDGRWKGKWRARVHVDGKEVHLGTFDTLEEAEAVAKKGRLKLLPFSNGK